VECEQKVKVRSFVMLSSAQFLDLSRDSYSTLYTAREAPTATIFGLYRLFFFKKAAKQSLNTRLISAICHGYNLYSYLVFVNCA